MRRPPPPSCFAAAWLAVIGGLAAQGAVPAPLEETWPDGSIKVRGQVDEQGRKHGAYEEFAANGTRTLLQHYVRDQRHGVCREWTAGGAKLRVQHYQDDVLHGPSEEFDDDGRPKCTGEYRKGERHGTWTDLDAGSDRRRTAEYRAGRLHGPLRITQKGKVVTRQTWRDGELEELDGMRPFPVPRERLRQELHAILTADPGPLDANDPLARARMAALRRLQAYRHLCGLPWTDMQLVPEWNLRCDAAAEVCCRNGGLDHHPPKPRDMDDARYQLGAEGARNSNLHRGVGLADAVDGFLDDSDPTNIGRVGHRRWCLNPAMQRTGFGAHGGFAAMWSMDHSGREPKGLDAVCYPPRGFVPVDLFATGATFSIATHRGREPRQETLRVALRELDADYVPAEAPLELDHCAVADGGFGRGPCVVFRSPALRAAVGRRYLVEVSFDGGETLAHRYVVEFCAAARDAAAGGKPK